MTALKQFKDQEFLSLKTFRKNGIGVKTPIWFVQDGNTFYLWTRGNSGKVKRIRNNARAVVDESDTAGQHVVSLLPKKIGRWVHAIQDN